MWKSIAVTGAILTIATAAWAHEGVKNPTVKARMMGMGEIAAATKIIGGMAAGKTAYDQAKLDSAAQALQGEAAQVTARFKAEETDPKSEALPAIWQDFAGFSQKADALVAAAEALEDVSSQAELKQAMGKIGGACRDCHQAYRQ